MKVASMDSKQELISENNWSHNHPFNARQSSSLFKFSMLLLILIIQFKSSWWSTWIGDVYPIFHGGYYVNWSFGDYIEGYEYWHIENTILIDMDLYSNEDTVITYTHWRFPEGVNSKIYNIGPLHIIITLFWFLISEIYFNIKLLEKDICYKHLLTLVNK